ncbi:hypothetical protein GCM10022221_31440 [Actinocorallia aurea]
MEVLLLPVALLLGFAVRDRTAAFLSYVAVHGFVFTFQTMTLLRAWVGGDRSAFPADPDSPAWSYALVNAVIYGAGLGLVFAGSRLRARRAARRAAVDLG